MWQWGEKSQDIVNCTIMPAPGGSHDKEFACNAGDLGLNPGSGRSPRRGHGNPLQYSYLENPYAQRSLAGCSPLGHKEWEMTEQLSTASQGSQCTARVGRFHDQHRQEHCSDADTCVAEAQQICLPTLSQFRGWRTDNQ